MRTPVWQVSLLIIDVIFHFLLPRTPTEYVRIAMWQWHETSAPGVQALVGKAKQAHESEPKCVS